MHLRDRSIPITDSTLTQLITELGSECENVTGLIYQLQSPHLSPNSKNNATNIGSSALFM